MSMPTAPVGVRTEQLLGVLEKHVSAIIARSVLRVALKRCGLSPDLRRVELTSPVTRAIGNGLRLYIGESEREECISALLALQPRRTEPPQGLEERVRLDGEASIVAARSVARKLAKDVGLGATDQTKVVTAVSEIARNALSYAGGGHMRIRTIDSPRRGVCVHIEDSGPGIDNLEHILNGDYVSKTGLGLGLVGCRRLMDELEVTTSAIAGTQITMKKYCP